MRPSHLRVSAFRVPTSSPEADGTFAWDHTILVTVEIRVGQIVGFGFSYADVATAHFVEEHLAAVVFDTDVLSPPAAFTKMEATARNVGRDGVAATAIAAVDMALWDAKAKQLGCSFVDLLGAVRDEVDAYASGGFTSYTPDVLRAQLRGYVEQGFRLVKMKIADDGKTLERVGGARDAIGDGVQLFVDANGAFTPKHALALANAMAADGVRWFEEPCSSDDLEGLRFVRERCPASMDVAAGEYVYRGRAFSRMLDSGAVDVVQADATRCGVTGFLRAAASCAERSLPLSAHCAPAIHAHLGCVAPTLVHVEYFHDHVRIEGSLFDGATIARAGRLRPDRSRPGLGLKLKRADAEAQRVFDVELPSGGAR